MTGPLDGWMVADNASTTTPSISMNEMCQIWQVWNATAEVTLRSEQERARLVERDRLIMEQRRQDQVAYEERVRQERARRDAAAQRAEDLLQSMLTEEQRESYKTNGSFDLTVEGGEQPPRHYRIVRGSSIRRLEAPKGRVLESWCVHPAGVPYADISLAQLLHLRHNEAELRRVANISRHDLY